MFCKCGKKLLNKGYSKDKTMVYLSCDSVDCDEPTIKMLKKTYLEEKEKEKRERSKVSRDDSHTVENKENIDIDQLLHDFKLLKKSDQRLRDRVNYLSRVDRKNNRVSHVDDILSDELRYLLKQHKPTNTMFHKEIIDDDVVGVIQYSDFHINEIINDVGIINKFDIGIANKRLQKYVSEAIKIFKERKVTHIHLCMTGDLINSDRRNAEKFAVATSRMKSAILAVYLIKESIKHLNQYFNVNVVSIAGNESRLSDDHDTNSFMMNDNFDIMIHEMLKTILSESDGITFDKDLIQKDPYESVVKINNYNWLITHGDQFSKLPDLDIQKLVGKYSLEKNINIRYTIFGHLHSAYSSSYFTRASSLCGGNSYSNKKLNLPSRASQPVYLAFKDGSINSYAIDLQSYSDYNGYDIGDIMKEYDVRSTREHEVIYE